MHMLCGRIAAGKSTLAAKLAQAPGTLLISQDQFLSALYPDELNTEADYTRIVPRFRKAMRPHLVALLRHGLSLALDLPANAVHGRTWMRSIFEEAGAAHVLHVLDTPVELCVKRLEQRNAAGTHEYHTTREQFDELNSYFTLPTEAEGFKIEWHVPEGGFCLLPGSTES